MPSEAVRDDAPERRTPVGTVNVVDPHPLNWLYITWNTMEEPVRTDETGATVGAAMEDSHWGGATLMVGYAHQVAALSPPYSGGAPEGLEPYAQDAQEAKRLLSEAGWLEGRSLRLATTSDVAAVAERLAGDFRDSLGVEVEMISIPDEDLVSAQKTFVEKNLPLPFDVLVHAWFDLAAGYPPAVIHREYFHSLGAFPAGPPLPEFEDLMARSVVETDAEKLSELGKQIDRLVYDQDLSIFLCCPMALVAVNRHVEFTGHAATLELAETEVTQDHWSRR